MTTPRACRVRPGARHEKWGRSDQLRRLPDGTCASVEFTPWEQTERDPGDNVETSAWKDINADKGGHYAAAAVASEPFADTPTVTLFDSRSRPYAVGTQALNLSTTLDTAAAVDDTTVVLAKAAGVAAGMMLTVTDGTSTETIEIASVAPSTKTVTLATGLANAYSTGDDVQVVAKILYELSEYDAEGNITRIQDRRSFAAVDAAGGDPGDMDHASAWNAFEHHYDLLGRQLYSNGQDNGLRWVLPDGAGQPAYQWKGDDSDSSDHWFRFRQEFDALRRPTQRWEAVDWDTVVDPIPERCRALVIYGERVTDPEADNYVGRIYGAYDSGGSTKVTGYDFKGNPLGQERQLPSLFDADSDWTLAAAETDLGGVEDVADDELELETFVSSATYDALDRVVTQVAPAVSGSPNTSTTTYGYDEGGALTSIDVNDRQGGERSLVTYIEHNARGQRTRLVLGSGVTTRYSYNPRSFRLTVLKSESGAGVLQDLRFVYDAAGNVVRIEDAAQQTIYFDNHVTEPVQAFTYDALYPTASGFGWMGVAP